MTMGAPLLEATPGRRAPGEGKGRTVRGFEAHRLADLPGASRVVAALPPSSRELLRARLPRVEVVTLEEHRPSELALACLVDPAYLEEGAPGGAWVRSLPQGLPVIMWGDMSPRGMKGLLRAEALRPLRILIDGVDDVPGTLAGMLPVIPRLAHVHRLLERLRLHFDQLPTALRTACTRAFETPESYFDATDLARAAHMSRRHLDRLLASAGFAPAKAIVVGARVWLAHLEIVAERRSVSQAAERLGYADGKALLRHIRAVTGDGAAGFRELAAEGCMERVVHHIQPV